MVTISTIISAIAKVLALAPGALDAVKALIALMKPDVTDDNGNPLTVEQVLAAIDAAFATWKGIENTADDELNKAAPPDPPPSD